jgi:hypothetical protein
MTAQSRTKQCRFTYSDEQWKAIKISLADAGIDADSFKRRRLEVVGWFYLEARSSETPKQYAAKMRKRRDVFKVAHAMLIDDDGDHFYWQSYYEGEDDGHDRFGGACRLARRAAREALAELIPYIQKRINQLKAMKGGSKNNARKRHVSFWYELTHLWHEFVPNAACQPRKHLLRFLFACSLPVFPEATNDKKLTAFIERYLPRYIPQKSTISRSSIAG